MTKITININNDGNACLEGEASLEELREAKKVIESAIENISCISEAMKDYNIEEVEKWRL